jgi:FkbM family methyltransferase
MKRRIYEYQQKKQIRKRQAEIVLSFRPGAGDGYPISENIQGDQYWKFDALEPTDRWLDAGAHIGTFAVVASPFVSQIICVEPDPETFKILAGNCQQNACMNVATLEGAVIHDDRWEVTLYKATNYDAYNCANSTIPIRGRNDTIAVSGIKLNDLIKIYHLTKLKLDIEGAEEKALYAIDDELWPQITDIFFEWHTNTLKDAGFKRLDPMISWLMEKGFHTAWHPKINHQRDMLAYVSKEHKEFAWASEKDVIIHM